MGFIIYDWETTGLNTKGFDRGLQFAAIYLDDNLNVVDTLPDAGPAGASSINIRGRLPVSCVPDPGALLVTGIHPSTLLNDRFSNYEMMHRIHDWIEDKRKNDPSGLVFMGYNSMAYDEDILRQELYQNLFPTYLTNTKDNMRADVIRFVYAAAQYRPDVIKIPEIYPGRRSHRLTDICRANGIDVDEAKAHDALYDVVLTYKLAQRIFERAPDLWHLMMENATKQDASDRCKEEQIFALTEYYFGKPFTRLVTFAGENPTREGDIAVFDLTFNTEHYVNDRPHELTWALEGKKPNGKGGMSRVDKALRPLIANKQPILVPYDQIPTHLLIEAANRSNLTDEFPPEKFPNGVLPRHVRSKEKDASFRAYLHKALMRRVDVVRNNYKFQDNVGTALRMRFPDPKSPQIDPPEHIGGGSKPASGGDPHVGPEDHFGAIMGLRYVEERIHDGFPCKEDEELRAKFHQAPWEERVAMVKQFQDERLGQLAERLIFFERPDLLEPKTRQKWRDWLKMRLTMTDNDEMGRHMNKDNMRRWLTAGDALNQIAEIKKNRRHKDKRKRPKFTRKQLALLRTLPEFYKTLPETQLARVKAKPQPGPRRKTAEKVSNKQAAKQAPAKKPAPKRRAPRRKAPGRQPS